MASIETLRLITRQLAIYCNSTLIITGILGSCANLFLFSRKRLRRSPSSQYILVASFFDFFNISFSVTTRLLADGFALDPFASNTYACRIRTFLAFVFSYCPMNCRSLSIVDRYLCSCRSVSLRNWSSTKVARRVLLVSCFFWILVGSLLLVFMDTTAVSATRVACAVSNPSFNNFFAYFLNPVAYFLLPLIIMTIFSIGAYRNLRHMTRTPNHGAQRRVEQQFIFMIIIESIIFTVSSLPNGIRLIMILATNAVQKSAYRVAQENLFYQIARITYFVSSASSFYLFVCLSSEIRAVLKRKVRNMQSNRSAMRTNRVGLLATVQPMIATNVKNSKPTLEPIVLNKEQ